MVDCALQKMPTFCGHGLAEAKTESWNRQKLCAALDRVRDTRCLSHKSCAGLQEATSDDRQRSCCCHCVSTKQVALLFLCSAPLSPLPGSVSHDSTHLTAHPLKSQLPEPVMHIGRHAAGQQARAVLTRMRVCCRLKGRASAGGPARSLAAAVLKRWQHHLSCQGRGGGPAGPWTTRAGTVHMHFHQAR